MILVVESELMLLVESTWNRVMQERRQALEEAYKIDLSAKPGSKDGQVSMGDVSPLWEETAMKSWQLFIGQSLLVCQHLRLLSPLYFDPLALGLVVFDWHKGGYLRWILICCEIRRWLSYLKKKYFRLSEEKSKQWSSEKGRTSQQCVAIYAEEVWEGYSRHSWGRTV